MPNAPLNPSTFVILGLDPRIHAVTLQLGRGEHINRLLTKIEKRPRVASPLTLNEKNDVLSIYLAIAAAICVRVAASLK